MFWCHKTSAVLVFTKDVTLSTFASTEPKIKILINSQVITRSILVACPLNANGSSHMPSVNDVDSQIDQLDWPFEFDVFAFSAGVSFFAFCGMSFSLCRGPAS